MNEYVLAAGVILASAVALMFMWSLFQTILVFQDFVLTGVSDRSRPERGVWAMVRNALAYKIHAIISTVVVSGLFIALIYSLFYGATGCVAGADGFVDSFYYSAVTFMTIGYGDMVPLDTCRLVSVAEGFAGLVFQITAIGLAAQYAVQAAAHRSPTADEIPSPRGRQEPP